MRMKVVHMTATWQNTCCHGIQDRQVNTFLKPFQEMKVEAQTGLCRQHLSTGTSEKLQYEQSSTVHQNGGQSLIGTQPQLLLVHF